MDQEKTIYFHVGLGKTGSTYLQKEVFTKFLKIKYIPPSSYRQCKRIIKAHKGFKFLVSREFDKQLEQELRWFCQGDYRVKVIVCLRRQEEWMASQYRRRVKNGWVMTFDEFVDTENDTGYWKTGELYYRPKIELIRKLTGSEPLVLLYDELRQHPVKFVERIAGFLEVPKPDGVSYTPRHASFSDKQLIILQWFCRKFIRKVPQGRSNKLAHWLLYRPVWAFYHLILYLSVFMPSSWLGGRQLIPACQMERVRNFFAQDWEAIKQFAPADHRNGAL